MVSAAVSVKFMLSLTNFAALNDLVKRSLDSAKIPSHLEPTGTAQMGRNQMELYIYNGAVEGWQGAGVGRHLCRHSSPLTQTAGI